MTYKKKFLAVLILSLPLIALADDSLIPSYYALDQNTQEPAAQTEQSAVTAEKNVLLLRDMLSLYQNAASYPWPAIPDSAHFALGKRSPYVLLLRQRLNLMGDLSYNENNSVYDSVLNEAVKDFQERMGLKPDGVIGKNTRSALNILPTDRVKQIQVNIQRWENLSPRLGHRYIMVNVPDYHLYLIDDDKVVLTMKAIVGKPSRQTPELTSRITQLVLKPYWNVPEKIAQKDIMTKAMADPNYLDKNKIRVYDDNNHRSQVNDNDIDWQAAKEQGTSFTFRQDPGERNSLGLVKFEFPNPYDVYLHDTPAKNLFSEEARDFSSGCVRLEKPFELVSYLMKDNPTWTDERRDELLAENKPTYVKIEKPMPVIITYITAWVDDKGKVNFRDDIYGRDDPTAEKSMVAQQED